jgi:hypothetical protein
MKTEKQQNLKPIGRFISGLPTKNPELDPRSAVGVVK